MTTDPTIAEVVRRLDDVTRQLQSVADRLNADYVRTDLYASHREADRDDVKQIAERMDKSEANQQALRRMLVTSIVAPILVALVVLYVTAQLTGAAS